MSDKPYSTAATKDLTPVERPAHDPMVHPAVSVCLAEMSGGVGSGEADHVVFMAEL